MVQFLQWLEAQTSTITEKDLADSAPIGGDEEEGEVKVIRPLNEEEKRLFSLISKQTRKITTLKKEHARLHRSGECTGSDCLEHAKKTSELETQRNLVRELFWESIRMSLESCPNHLQITKEWQLAEVKAETENDELIEEFIDGLFGGILGLSFSHKNTPK